ncbi:MAG: M23 family metallopeptidase [Chitinispirillales bacterium]|nr:M23 family metallopeptidase [Chitinispirillales bacterium]
MKKQQNHYTFMFFPEGKGNPFTLRIHRYTLYLTVTSVVIIILGLFLLLYKTGETALRLQLVHNLKQENARLRENNRNLAISSQKIASIDSMTAYLHRLAGVANIRIGDTPPDAYRSAGVAVAAASQPALAGAARVNGRGGHGVSDAASTYASSVPNIMPVNGWITKHFARGSGRVGAGADSHNGIDIAAAHGTPIRATAMGVVEDIRNDRYLGLTVEIRHDHGFVTRYSHCSQVLVSLYDRVNRGQTIALVGNTGRSTAPHLHYEVLKNGRYVDPMEFIGVDQP